MRRKEPTEQELEAWDQQPDAVHPHDVRRLIAEIRYLRTLLEVIKETDRQRERNSRSGGTGLPGEAVGAD